MLEKKFLIDKEALVAASKVAYLVHLIRNSDSIIEKYKIADIEDIEIPKEYRKRLKVIKKINEEAYFYMINTLKNLNLNGANKSALRVYFLYALFKYLEI